MNNHLSLIKPGLALVMLGLVFGIGMGIAFGIGEDIFKEFVASGIEAHAEVHDEKSQSKIWRYAQRAHFHATGIAAFSIGLLLLLSVSGMSDKLKKATSIFIGLGSFYPLSWLNMFLLAPAMGRGAAHSHFVTELFVYIGVGGLVIGFLLLNGNIFFNLLADKK